MSAADRLIGKAHDYVVNSATAEADDLRVSLDGTPIKLSRLETSRPDRFEYRVPLKG